MKDMQTEQLLCWSGRQTQSIQHLVQQEEAKRSDYFTGKIFYKEKESIAL